MKNKTTYYQLILDRSGSMQDCIAPTINGFNEQIQMIRDLKKRYPEQEFKVSLSVFNHDIQHLHERIDISEFEELNRHTYKPDGSTALLDAVGESVTLLNVKIAEEIRKDEATAVVVIITDGYENASRFYNLDTIRSMIKELESGGAWNFSFLGATPDAVETAMRMNIRRSNALAFEKSETRHTYHTLSTSMEEYINQKSKGIKSKDFLKKK